MQLVFDTNFWGPVRVFQAALPLFPKTGEACMERLGWQNAKPQVMPSPGIWQLASFLQSMSMVLLFTPLSSDVSICQLYWDAARLRHTGVRRKNGAFCARMTSDLFDGLSAGLLQPHALRVHLIPTLSSFQIQSVCLQDMPGCW